MNDIVDNVFGKKFEYKGNCSLFSMVVASPR
jgi:hypothetical protein